MADKNKDTVDLEMDDKDIQVDNHAQTEDGNDEATQAEDTNEAETQDDGDTEETVQDPLEAAQEQIAALKDQLLRTAAEFDNYKKRTIKEKMELIQNGGAKAVAAILPILDDFERAVADKSEDAAAIKEGTKVIFNKFVKTLESLGVKQIDTEDQDFNTDYHEAVAMVPGVDDDKKGRVIDCVQTGYIMNDKVIRHAKVAVGQ
ncbi:co-chaperone GrpE [Hallella bergensis DSM 17361]|uniref:Protein GrpE n=1 Tax=Hallella bergensis DSM 17361 TaxID=585502 RepID=D1PSW7_9BACT|nr:nucleotide exchange factor GrpE [Hallella bergensis]EFA45435.1 co-chaperone GrpE [Hallella bergensis DSM 17361]